MKQQAELFCEKWQSFDRLYEEYAKSRGLTYVSLIVLEIIYENQENCTQTLICQQSHYTKQSVNMIIKSFWEKGYVELKELVTDRRNKQIRFSKKGVEYADKIIGDLFEIERNAMETMTYEQRKLMIELTGLYEESFCIGMNKLIDSNN